MADWEAAADRKERMMAVRDQVRAAKRVKIAAKASACGGGGAEQLSDEKLEAAMTSVIADAEIKKDRVRII